MKFFLGSIEVTEEPEPDDDLSFEIITEEEIASLTSAFSASLSSSSSSASITSQGSTSSSESISSQGSSSSLGSSGYGPTAVKRASGPSNVILLSEEELTSATRIWYMIQLKGHHHEDDLDNHHLGTMEQSSMKRTGWFFNLLHLHDRMKQSAADKNRFNINSIPETTRQQLKQMYVY